MKTKKYHGQPLASFVPNIVAGQLPTLTAAQFADLDLWTLPRRLCIIITDVPIVGSIILIRMSSALRFNWKLADSPALTQAPNLRPLQAAALYKAAQMPRPPGGKSAGHRSTGFVVIWLPLLRSGREAMERLHAERVAIWNQAQQLCVDAAAALAGGI